LCRYQPRLRGCAPQKLFPERVAPFALEWHLFYLSRGDERIIIRGFCNVARSRSGAGAQYHYFGRYPRAPVWTDLGSRMNQLFGNLNQFVLGAITLGFFLIGLFFLRFWKKVHDRFFLIFGVAFFVLGLERLILAFTDPAFEYRPFIYLVRLAAFILIILAVIDKNRGGK
jgi:hypothetical protein